MANDKTDASKLIDDRIRELGDWRGKTLSMVRGIIRDADPAVVEEWKWVKPTNPGTPVWSHSGDICTGETYKNAVKLTFFKGAALKDPSGLFNSSLDGKVSVPSTSKRTLYSVIAAVTRRLGTVSLTVFPAVFISSSQLPGIGR